MVMQVAAAGEADAMRDAEALEKERLKVDAMPGGPAKEKAMQLLREHEKTATIKAEEALWMMMDTTGWDGIG